MHEKLSRLGAPVRIATFNIKHATRADDRVDHRALVRSCAALNADVLGMQEVDRHRARTKFRDQAALVARRLGYEVVYGAVIHHGRFGQYGNALLARGPIDQVDHFALPKPSRRQRRAAVIARVSLPDRVLTVAVTHLQHHPTGLDESQREAPAQLRALLDRLVSRSTPLVVLGDFNLGAGRAGPPLLSAGFDVVPSLPTFPRDNPRTTLDYVAVQGMRVLAVEVVATDISDHRAVVATLGDAV